MQNRASQANAQLPSDVLSSGVTTKKTTPDTLMYIALFSPQNTYDDLFLTNYAAINIVETIKRVKGGGNVQLYGAEFGMRIWLHPNRMATLGLTSTDVYHAIQEQNVQAPAGQVGRLAPIAGLSGLERRKIAAQRGRQPFGGKAIGLGKGTLLVVERAQRHFS